MRKYWRNFFSLAICISMVCAVPAYGELTVVPPPPSSGISQPNIPGEAEGPGAAAGPGAGIGSGTAGGSTTGLGTLAEPQIQSQGAVLMDASTGKLLFEKNGETRYYPASITKLMTVLLVAERANLNDTVTFSKEAVTNLESGAVTLGLAEGDKLTVNQCMYGLMLKSANEVANGLAEHVSGSFSAFAELMNKRARELGCTGTNFVNPNGLNHANHYTTPHDMAKIASAAYNNQIVRKVTSTLSYQIPATQKAGARTISMGHKMLYPNDARYYEGIVGGKTGYTSLAGNTLVTCAERNGVRLVAVVMKSASSHYADTKALLDYGFSLKDSGSLGWEQSGTVWNFMKTDGAKAANEWLRIEGRDYWFDSNSTMAVGWRQFDNGAWYYFKPSGAMAFDCWVQSDGKWFYLGENGALLKNTVTPDGYQVDGNGIWTE